MATVPTPFLQQINPPANEQVVAFEVPREVTLGTLSVRALNKSGQNIKFSWWLTPGGVGSAEDRHLIQSTLELKPGASSVDFGFAVGAGYKVYVHSDNAGVVYTCNLLGHTNPALEIPTP